jgi:hypothetical protein
MKEESRKIKNKEFANNFLLEIANSFLFFFMILLSLISFFF